MDLTYKFTNGLAKYKISFEDIKNGKFKYCGGDKGRHLNYFNMAYKDWEKPEYDDTCICGHKIIENCYITDGEYIIVLGNCCIKKFVPKSSRTCEICGKPHKKRIVNRCDDCRKGICDICNKKCNKDYTKCYNCGTK